jgi:hypothetical protein
MPPPVLARGGTSVAVTVCRGSTSCTRPHSGSSSNSSAGHRRFSRRQKIGSRASGVLTARRRAGERRRHRLRLRRAIWGRPFHRPCAVNPCCAPFPRRRRRRTHRRERFAPPGGRRSAPRPLRLSRRVEPIQRHRPVKGSSASAATSAARYGQVASTDGVGWISLVDLAPGCVVVELGDGKGLSLAPAKDSLARLFHCAVR